jgi:heat shock protein HslJ
MNPKSAIHNTHKILLALFLLALAAWGTSCTSSTQEEQPTQQQATQQETTQQETTQQAASPATTASSSSDELAARFVGTWEKTSFQGEPVPPGTQVVVFSPDGTLQSSTSDGSEDWTGQYRVLDDSHIQFTVPTGSYVANYTLNGDVLTMSAQGQTGTFQRTRVD